MTTLEEAWGWYRSTVEAGRLLKTLGGYWDRLPWDDMPPAPDRLRRGTGETFTRTGTTVLQPLEDVAVFVLFSVFEALVRDIVREQIRPEKEALQHPALVSAGEGLLDAIDEGSFSRILELLKTAATADLIEHVNQVRRYRNWVAHSRRPDRRPAAVVDPKTAYDRLRIFLERIRQYAPPGQ